MFFHFESFLNNEATIFCFIWFSMIVNQVSLGCEQQNRHFRWHFWLCYSFFPDISYSKLENNQQINQSRMKSRLVVCLMSLFKKDWIPSWHHHLKWSYSMWDYYNFLTFYINQLINKSGKQAGWSYHHNTLLYASKVDFNCTEETRISYSKVTLLILLFKTDIARFRTVDCADHATNDTFFYVGFHCTEKTRVWG